MEKNSFEIFCIAAFVSFFEPVSEVLVVELDPPELFPFKRFQPVTRRSILGIGATMELTTDYWNCKEGFSFQDTLVMKKSNAVCAEECKKKHGTNCRSIKLSVKQKNSPI